MAVSICALFLVALCSCLTARASDLPAWLVDEPITTIGHSTLHIAAAASVGPEGVKMTKRLSKISSRKAREALLKAETNLPLLSDEDAAVVSAAAAVDPKAVCGTNSLVTNRSLLDCKIIVGWGSGTYSTCSAFKIGARHLGTAGHCIFSKGEGGWASSIDVYCYPNACNKARTTWGANIATTQRWMASSTDKPTAWDAAVIRTGTDLPGGASNGYLLAQFTQVGNFRAILSGYPAQNPESNACNSAAFANACSQYSSTDSLNTRRTAASINMYTSSALDFCRGHSGSGVRDATATNRIVAIESGASTSPCVNYLTPLLLSSNVNASTCEAAGGGASLACLASKVV